MALEFKKNDSTFIGDMDVTSGNGRYKVQYTIVGNNLQTVTAQVFSKEMVDIPNQEGSGTVKQEQEISLGEISMQFGSIVINRFPYSNKFALYMNDFNEIIDEILRSNV